MKVLDHLSGMLVEFSDKGWEREQLAVWLSLPLCCSAVLWQIRLILQFPAWWPHAEYECFSERMFGCHRLPHVVAAAFYFSFLACEVQQHSTI